MEKPLLVQLGELAQAGHPRSAELSKMAMELHDAQFVVPNREFSAVYRRARALWEEVSGEKLPPHHEEFRQVGFTGAAAEFPRDELALAMLAAFNGVRPDQMPEPWKYFPNEATKRAWTNVADAARAHVLLNVPAPEKR